ncbi:964_t:CDS:2 [Ambispora gerdemannii]|uniref:964_t:CDS:1 n=1 Tax=Ambispora gerdemannii TaxID=144530 RepID=A0A9N8VZ59_9GLOM|nr:964_t:CDS:2 [Ambispora gerdemannii]
MVNYGKFRDQNQKKIKKDGDNNCDTKHDSMIERNSSFRRRTSSNSSLTKLTDLFVDLTVPKRWFRHFYVLGVLWVTFVTYELLIVRDTNDCLFVRLLRHFEDYYSTTISLSYQQPRGECVLALLMLQIQTTRRMFECFWVERPSLDSKMHIGHYMVGITFYFMMGIAVWIEGSGWFLNTTFASVNEFLAIHIPFAIFLFIYASHHQHIQHKILASLRTSSSPRYSLPTGDWFDVMSSAHYFSEILIYISFVILTKAKNFTLWLALIATIFNLIQFAIDSYHWEHRVFKGDVKLQKKKWIIIPFIY